MQHPPIAFFAYNRPAHTRRALEALSANPEFGKSPIYAFCDGPRDSASDDDRASIAAVRALISEGPWVPFLVPRFRERNVGLLRSLLDGVSEVVAAHGAVIVVEDDVVAAPGFLDYFGNALDLYRDEQLVMHVSAYSPLWRVPDWYGETSFIFNHSYVGWGWATWSRAWAQLSTDGRDLQRRLDARVARRYANIDDTYEIYWALKHLDDGRSQDWNVYWNASILAAGGLCLNPVSSLADNIGFDGSGFHCDEGDSTMLRPVAERIALGLIPLREDPQLRRLITRRPLLDTIKFKSMHGARTLRHRYIAPLLAGPKTKVE